MGTTCSIILTQGAEPAGYCRMCEACGCQVKRLVRGAHHEHAVWAAFENKGAFTGRWDQEEYRGAYQGFFKRIHQPAGRARPCLPQDG
ncbi:MAG: hypothetical protein ACLTBV_08475 [Enterocloster bolteae]